MEEFLCGFLLLFIEFASILSAIRFKEDSKVIIEPEETVSIELINESPRDGKTVSISLHAMNGDQIDLVKEHNSSDAFQFEVPVDLAGSGLTEIVAKSETGAECSTIIFIK